MSYQNLWNYHVVVNDSGFDKTYFVSDDADRANMVLQKVLAEGKNAKIIKKPDNEIIKFYLDYI